MKYCGIDLHSNNSVVLVSDGEDRIVYQKRLPNDLCYIDLEQKTLQPLDNPMGTRLSPMS